MTKKEAHLGLVLVFAFCLSAQAMSASKSNATRVWVSRPDGSIQCDQPKSGQSLDQGMEALKKAGVEVFESKKASDQLMHAAVCGIPTGKENVYLISEKDLEKAKKEGFSPSSK